jgi:hypothetical protein
MTQDLGTVPTIEQYTLPNQQANSSAAASRESPLSMLLIQSTCSVEHALPQVAKAPLLPNRTQQLSRWPPYCHNSIVTV